MNKDYSQKKVFFIRGYIRSGTNWVNNILNLHPDIQSYGEFNFIPIRRGFEFVTTREWGLISKKENKSGNEVARSAFETMVKEITIKVGRQKLEEENLTKTTKKDPIWFGDRSPNPLTPLPIEAGYYFWIVRDVRDILISSTFHELRLEYSESAFSAFPKMKEKKEIFKDNPNYFSIHPEQLLDDKDWVMHIAQNWHNQTTMNIKLIKEVREGKHPANIKVLRYEDIHTNAENTRRDMYTFLNVDPEKALPMTDLTTPGFTKERPNNHYRKGAVGGWKEYIFDDTHEIIKNITKESMDFFNYSFNE
jgi:hypothetical protein